MDSENIRISRENADQPGTPLPAAPDLHDFLRDQPETATDQPPLNSAADGAVRDLMSVLLQQQFCHLLDAAGDTAAKFLPTAHLTESREVALGSTPVPEGGSNQLPAQNGPLEFREPRYSEAPALPAAGIERAAGTSLEQADGSRVFFEAGPDGKVRPAKIAYPNGMSSEYTYGADGKLNRVVTKDKDQREISSVTVSADGTKISLTIGNRKQIDNIEGTLTARTDGTWKLTTAGQRPESWQTTSDGSVLRDFRGGGNAQMRVITLPDQSILLERKRGDGEYHPASLTGRDGVRFTYSFDDNGKPRQIVQSRAGTAPLFYDTTDGGVTWTRTVKNDNDAVHQSQAGTLTLDKSFRPIFRDRGERPVEVNDGGEARTEVERQRARIAKLQETVTKTFDLIYEAKTREKVHDVTKTWREELQAKGGLQKLSAEDQKKALEDLGKRITDATKPIKEEKDRERGILRREMDLLRSELRKPREQQRSPEDLWQLLPETKKLYRESIDWLEKKAVPSALQQICGAQGGEMPPNNPHAVPLHEGTRYFLDPAYYNSLAAGGAFADKVNMGVNPDTIPTQESLERVGRAMGWLVDVQNRISSERLDYETRVLLPTIIRDNHLPEQWLRDFGENPEGKRAAIKEMLDIAFKLRNYSSAMAMMKLDQGSEGPAFFWPGGDTREKIPPPPFAQRIERDGRVTYRFDWPENLNLEDPANLAKIEAYREWLNKYGDKLDQALRAWSEALDPKKRLFYGEIEGEVYVKFDKDGKLDQILEPVNASDPPDVKERKQKALEGARRCNLLDSDFEIEEHNGRIYPKATLQAKNSHRYNYLNIGATREGKPSVEDIGPIGPDGKPRGFAPDEMVAVRDGSGQIHVVAARDLKSWKSYQQFTYWGSKIATGVMDVGMTAAGLATGGTAALAWNAGKITAGVALRTIVPALIRAGLGASGFFLNNAEAHSDPTWRTVNEIRGGLMVLDVFVGNVRGVAGLAGFGRGAEAVAAAEKFALSMKEGLDASNWMLRGIFKPLYYATEVEGTSRPYHWLMGSTNAFYGPTIAADLVEHAHTLQNLGKPNPFALARSWTEAGHAADGVPATTDGMIAAQRRQSNIRLFDSYVSLIAQRTGIDAQTKQSVLEIAQRTKDLLDPKMPDELTRADVPDARRQEWRDGKKRELEAYKAQLLNFLYGPQQQLAQQIADANKGKERNEAMSADAVRALRANGFTPDKDLQTAAAAALLALSTDDKGALPAEGIIGSRTLNLPAHKMYVSRTEIRETPHGAIPHTVRDEVDGPLTAIQNVRISDLESFLKNNVSGDSPALKMVSADLLVKLGLRDQFSYAAVLRNMLAEPRATNIEKAASIVQLGQMINALRLIESNMDKVMTPEEQAKFRAYGYGLTSRDLQESLQKLAGDPSADKNMRGLAASVIADLGTTVRPEELSAMLGQRAAACAEYLKTDNRKEGFYSQEVRTALESDLRSRDAGIRMRAALALRALADLGPFAGADGATTFNHAMVEIAQLAARNGLFQEVGARAVAEMDLKEDRFLSAEDRESLRKILADEQTEQNNAVLKSAITRRAHEIAKTAAEKSAFAETIADHITFGNKNYAEKFPGLREACCYALSNLADTTATAALAKCIRPPEQGKRPYHDYEPDARVRLAALNALISLRAFGLDRLLTDAFGKETDAAVRARLLEVKIQTHRPVPDWTYFHERDRLAAQAIDGSRYSIDGAREWLRALSGPLSYQGSENGIPVPAPRLSREEDVYEMEYRRVSDGLGSIRALEPVYKGKRTVWYDNPASAAFWRGLDDQVYNKARDDNADGHKARMALIYLVLKNGDPIKGDDTSPDRRRVVDKAVDRIVELMHPGSGFKGEMLPGVRDILADPMVDASVRMRLLTALKDYLKAVPEIERRMKAEGKPNSANLAANYRVTVGQFVVDALKRDLIHVNQVGPDKTAAFNARQDLRMQMIDLIRELKPYQSLQVLEAITIISDREWLAKYKPFQDKAKEVLADIRDSVKAMWGDPAFPTNNGTAIQRADLIRNALSIKPDGSSVSNSYAIAEAIFKAAKGLPITSAADPRIAVVRLALNNESPAKQENVNPVTADLSAKITKPGSEGSDNMKLDQNGSDQVRLAAALVILRSENSGFTAEDRRKAIEAVAKISFQGHEYGYRRDAIELLLPHLAQKDNHVALLSLAKAAAAEPALMDKTIEVGGKQYSIRKLLDDNFKADADGASRIAPGSGAYTQRVFPTANGEIRLQFEFGRLHSITEQLPGGKSIRTRQTGDGMIVEIFDKGKLAQVVLPAGKNYVDILLKDAEVWSKLPPSEQFRSLLRIFSQEGVETAATDAQRIKGLDAIKRISESVAMPQEIRRAAAEFLIKGEGLKAAEAAAYRKGAVDQLAELAGNGDLQALAALKGLPAAMKEQALATIVANYDKYVSGCASQTVRNRQERQQALRLADSLPLRYRESARRYLQAIGQDPDRPSEELVRQAMRAHPDINPDRLRLQSIARAFAELEAVTPHSRSTDALLLEFAAKAHAAPISQPKEQDIAGILKPRIDAALERMKSDPVKDNDDPRKKHFDAYFPQERDQQKLNDVTRQIDAVKSKTDNERYEVYNRIALDLSKLCLSDSQTVRGAAQTQLDSIINQIAGTNPTPQQSLFKLALMRAQLEAAMSLRTIDNREIKDAKEHVCWQNLIKILDKANESKESSLYRHAQLRLNETAPKVDGKPPIALAQQYEQQAREELNKPGRSSSISQMNARDLMKKALEVREQNLQSDSAELARHRIRYAQFLLMHYGDSRDSYEVQAGKAERELQEAARVLQLKEPHGGDLAKAYMKLAELAGQRIGGRAIDQARILKYLTDAVKVYEDGHEKDDPGLYAQTLVALRRHYSQNDKIQEAKQTEDKLFAFCRSDMPEAARARVMVAALPLVEKENIELLMFMLDKSERLAPPLDSAVWNELGDRWWRAGDMMLPTNMALAERCYEACLKAMGEGKDTQYTNLINIYSHNLKTWSDRATNPAEKQRLLEKSERFKQLYEQKRSEQNR